MKISVISARSGAGKTLVATSLALSLAGDNPGLQFLDCHVEKPDAHLFLKPSPGRSEVISTTFPQWQKDLCTFCGDCGKVCSYNAIVTFAKNVLIFPDQCHSCGACSYFCNPRALLEEKKEIGTVTTGRAGSIDFVQGRLSPGSLLPMTLIKKIREQEKRSGLVIVDTAPGVSNQVSRAITGSDYCLLVAMPDTTGNQPLNRMVESLRNLGIPFGVVLNFSGTGDHEIAEYCEIQEIPILLTIPRDIRIAKNYAKGMTLSAGLPEWQDRFGGLFQKIRELVSERNCRTG
jgi:MinD superfamily P-loop ATPase